MIIRHESLLRIVLLGIWSVMFLTGLIYIARYALTNPYVDEWWFMPVLIGDEPAGPWIWELHNEHRFPLPRVVYLGLFRLTGDLRIGCYVSFFGISFLALGLMRLAKHVRGRASITDVVFPLMLMHTGQDENLYMGYQLCFMLVAVLSGSLLAMIVWRRNSASVGLSTEAEFRRHDWRLALASTLIGWLLLACGAGGLVYGIAAMAWVVLLAIQGSMAKWQRVVLITCSVITPLYIWFCFQGYVRPSHHPESAGIYESIRVGLQAQAIAFGPAATGLWPAIGVGILIAGFLVVGQLARRWMKSRGDLTSAGLLLFIGAGTAVAFGIGWGRSGFFNDMGFAWRYGWITFPPVAAAYFTWLARGGRVFIYAPTALFLFVLIVTPVNSISGFWHAETKLKPREAAWEADVRSGMTPDEIVAKHYPDASPAFRREMADILRLMRDRAYTYYGSLGREIP